jgi:hypothetical protein
MLALLKLGEDGMVSLKNIEMKELNQENEMIF